MWTEQIREMILNGILETLYMTVVSTLFGYVFGLPMGVLLCISDKDGLKPHPVLYKILDFIANIVRSVPFLILLILLIPFMGTGIKPALTALILLAIPPILLNTAAGLQGVPDFMLETAYGMGMTEQQVLFKVKFPLALPLIMTGLKTAMIEIIASATLASKIGAGGLGDIIFTGLGLNRPDLLLVGGITVALLSITATGLLELLDHLLLKYKYLKKE